MKKLNIEWSHLELAFDPASDPGVAFQISNYLDTQTGRVILLHEELTNAADEIIEELGGSQNGETWTDEEIESTVAYENVPEWIKPNVFEAIQVLHSADKDRFEEIPRFTTDQCFGWMRDFTDSIDDDGIRDRLNAALGKHKPFRNFREAIGSDRRLDQQWCCFEQDRQREAIIEWLNRIGVQPLNAEEGLEPQSLPDLRKIMFAEVRRFVRFARDIAGVERIALIGSLTEDKEFPKDVDLLVTVTDDCDLAPLATLSRQLTGHLAAHNVGADIFLANSNAQYIGRTCPWKKCGRGIRASCDAISCGARKYLHDDFKAIRLNENLVQSPPVQLWPEVKAAPNCPSDLREQLLQPLLEDPSR